MFLYVGPVTTFLSRNMCVLHVYFLDNYDISQIFLGVIENRQIIQWTTSDYVNLSFGMQLYGKSLTKSRQNLETLLSAANAFFGYNMRLFFSCNFLTIYHLVRFLLVSWNNFKLFNIFSYSKVIHWWNKRKKWWKSFEIKCRKIIAFSKRVTKDKSEKELFLKLCSFILSIFLIQKLKKS